MKPKNREHREGKGSGFCQALNPKLNTLKHVSLKLYTRRPKPAPVRPWSKRWVEEVAKIGAEIVTNYSLGFLMVAGSFTIQEPKTLS